MVDSNALLKPFIEDLHQSGRLRVWSIVITIFGDLVQPRGGRISLQELLTLTEKIGIEGNALRTAMSRLAKEGWVERFKDGRNSHYGLSNSGKATFLAASERIYQPNFSSDCSDWIVGLYPEEKSKQNAEAFWSLMIGKRMVICSTEDKQLLEKDGAFVLSASPNEIPDWVRSELVPHNLTLQYRHLLYKLTELESNSRSLAALSPLSAITLRYLMIHFWRRLVLRHPLLPKGLMTDDWEGIKSHTRICDLYPEIANISEAWWEKPTQKSGLKIIHERFHN
ncbi:MAG: PaaX family transcriptional regulator C-terminal domain-containing protein [Pseudomonadota bacterium]